MIIKIKLNDMKFRYEVYHIVSLFFSFYDIKFVDKNYDYYIDISIDKVICGNKIGSESFVLDNEITLKEGIKKSIFKYFYRKTKKELPWGTLIGIRPSKIALDLINKGKKEEEIIKHFKKHNMTRKDKAELCINVAKVERNIVNKDKNNISVYIDMPFCPTRCLYCSFASNPILKCKNIVKKYLSSLYYEMDEVAKIILEKNFNIECVYFGGGTPTAIDDMQFEETMLHIYNNFIENYNIKEFTVECGRPDSITLNKLNTMKKYKVDRISINPQTMNENTLQLIGRRHSAKDVIDKFNLARKCGFDNINMDIIVGLPGEDLNSIKRTCREILKLNPDSLTVHGLAIKRGSKLHENMINKDKLNIINQHELNNMYEETVLFSKRMDMKPYYMYRQKNMVGNMDNVGYCKKEKECLYNIQMIEERQSIFAIGADAVSKVVFLEENRIERVPNVKDVREYIKRVEEMVKRKQKAFEDFI